MAATTLANIQFQSDIFTDVVQGAFTHKLELLNNLLVEAPDQIISPQSTGYTVDIPTNYVPSGDSVQITTSTTTTINALATWRQRAAWVEREKAWGADQALIYIAGRGYDRTVALAEMIGEYWASELHASAVSLLTGVFATALASTHSYDDTPNTINTTGLMAAKTLLGDNMEDLSAIVMNSKVYADAIKDRLTYKDTIGGMAVESGLVEMLLGLMVKKSDKLAVSSGVYSSYIGRPGSLIYKFRERQQARFTNSNVYTINAGGIKIEVELNRVATTAGGQDQMITRSSYLVHCPGVDFDGTVTSNPTNTELATGTTWTKTAPDDKLIKLIQYKSA